MRSPAHDLAVYLGPKPGLGGFGGANQWCVHAVAEPDAPDNCVTLYDTGGTGEDTDEMDLVEVTFQVRVRCKSYPEGYAIHEIVRDLLMVSGHISTGTSTFVLVSIASDVSGIGRDGSDRHLLVANYRAVRKEI